MPELVSLDRSGPVAVLTLNDPDRRNILTGPLVAQLASAMDTAESDPHVRAVILTGAGSTFCAGAELATLERAADGDFGLIREVYDGFLRVLHSPLLTVGAINGPAVGAGMNLALACDMRIASESAKFICRFNELGILPGGGHVWMLSRAVGGQKALAGVLLGEPWNATEALEDGLVLDVVAPEELIQSARKRLAGLERLEGEYVRRLVAAARRAPLIEHNAALELEAIDQEWSVNRSTFLEGLARIRGSIGRR